MKDWPIGYEPDIVDIALALHRRGQRDEAVKILAALVGMLDAYMEEAAKADGG